ncbi:MAG TPA: glutathione S-transferase family protein [Steroidobacteraceae bacterium]|nr:glutathione S-transferase family protein [Steroidobacteraceae bacterium]
MKRSIYAFSAGLMLLVATAVPVNYAAAAEKAAAKPALTIYHIEGRRSQRVVWLCEELGIPYQLEFKRGDIAGSMEAIRAVNPLMPVAPTVRIDDSIMVESGAILEYLVQKYGHGKLAPAMGSEDYRDYLMWLHFSEGSAMPRMLSDLQRMMLKGEKTITPNVFPGSNFQLVGSVEILKFIEAYLAEHPYFGGQSFSAADIMMHFVAVAGDQLPGIDMSAYPHFRAWRKTVESRPAFARTTTVALPDGKSPDGRGVQGPQK